MTDTPLQLPLGTIIGQWKIHEPIGRGGQGSIWSVKPAKTKRSPFRAIKLCLLDDAKSQARFEREIALLKHCESPHVLKLLDHDSEWKKHVDFAPPFAYYVSERCKGSLEDRQKDLGDLRARLTLFRQACNALLHLHGLADPILHRDIKPANLLLSQELGHLVLADFGLARSLTRTTPQEQALTDVFEVVGTPYYRAPEVTNGQHGTIRSDIYGLGRLLEWLLTDDVSRDMATRPIPRGLDVDGDACEALDQIITRATQPSAAYRFASVTELLEHLPDLWLAVKPRTKKGPPSLLNSPEATFASALAFTKANDHIALRDIESQLRRRFADELPQWRATTEPTWQDRNRALGFAATDRLLDCALPRITLALAGIYSNTPSLMDQRRIIDDFISFPDWNQNGKTSVIEAPRALLYPTHYLHGALCVTYNTPDTAIAFASTEIPYTRRNERAPLWMHHEFTGWPAILGGQCNWAWEYLQGLYEQRPVLQQLFALRHDYILGLGCYSLLLSLMELGSDAARMTTFDAAKVKDIRLTVPPLFAGLPINLIERIGNRVLRNGDIVELVARRSATTVPAMQRLWPTWKLLILQFRREVFDRFSYPDELPLGDLSQAPRSATS
ncbi:MAG: serine/threonine protein kinase [Myxococcales bacterium]|nr:serine/threonine protein kinase [Myxococcales bacterium]